jgi:hypothetical protein
MLSIASVLRRWWNNVVLDFASTAVNNSLTSKEIDPILMMLIGA